eukprot:9611668-Heterocapsa_arctica.AAC.1
MISASKSLVSPSTLMLKSARCCMYFHCFIAVVLVHAGDVPTQPLPKIQLMLSPEAREPAILDV